MCWYINSPLPSGRLLLCRCLLLCSWWLGSPGWTGSTCVGGTWALRCGPPSLLRGSWMRRWPTPRVCPPAPQGSQTASCAQTSARSGSCWRPHWTTRPPRRPGPSRSFSHAARGHFAWTPGQGAPLCSLRFLTGCPLTRRWIWVTSVWTGGTAVGVETVGQPARPWSLHKGCTRPKGK